MRKSPTIAVAIIGAGALVGSVFTDAMASVPGPKFGEVHTAAKKYSVNGDLSVNGVLRVQKNLSVNNGRMYAHKGLQVWQGLLIHGGGIKTDSLAVSGQIQGSSAIIAGNLQADAVNGSSLAIQNAATVGGSLTVKGGLTAGSLSTGAITATSIVAPSGGATTFGGTVDFTGATVKGLAQSVNFSNTGSINTGTGTLTTAGIASSGPITTASLTSSGALTAASLTTTQGITTPTIGGPTNSTLTISGPVNFTGNVSGLNLNNLNLNGATLSTLNVGTNCNTSGQSGPLFLCQNSQTAQLGVASNGAVNIGGSAGIVTGVVTAPTVSGTTNPGTLTLQGNGINLNGTVNLQNGSDLNLGTTTNNGSSHILSNGDTDVAGTVGVTIPATQITDYPFNVQFARSYSRPPVVVITPNTDPAPSTSISQTNVGTVRYWVTPITTGSQYSGFTIHYVPPAQVTSQFNLSFNYHVIGS